MTDKMELTKHHKAKYGHLLSQRDPEPDRCAGYASMNSDCQCYRKRHPDTLDGAFCKLHCPERRKARREARSAKQWAEAAARQAKREKAAQ